MKDRYRECQFLFPSQGEKLYQGVAFLLKIQSLQQFIGFPGDYFIAKAVNTAEKTDILPHPEIFIQRKFLAHIADISFDQFILFDDIIACHGSISCRWHADTAKHLHRRGLTRSVSTQEAKYFTLFHIE